ncbi:MAG TPA: phospho-N-acetylmuramoyl-pentapeptide-transferase, partial [Rhodospirillaceae bacterium]|nr:phospho-N-acetylmuramoyl-pentapeptide-transferase [Rhodospirillaceae bacterium]
MLYNLLYPLVDQVGVFNLFRYLTFRTGGAVLTSLLISFLAGPSVIRWLRRRQGRGQPIRSDGPESHLLTKKGTPTMGGFLILLALTLSTLVWADLTNAYVWIVLLVTLGYGLIGFADDFLKVSKRNPKGLPGKLKLCAQVAIAAIAAVLVMRIMPDPLAQALAVPIFKNLLLQMGPSYVLFSTFVMVGSSNAVNLTDG